MPEWVVSQRRARDLCEVCGGRPAATAYAGTGQEVCWGCLDHLREKANA